MSTGLDIFDTTIEKTNLLLRSIEEEFGWKNRRNQSYLALRTVLHAIRDRLPADVAVNFSAQLPLLVKGIYFDGWQPENKPVKMHREEFLLYIGNEFKYDVEGGLERLAKRVSEKIFSMYGQEEILKILDNLPDDIALLIS